LKSRKNTNFGLEGVDYGLSPYISSVWENETMPYIINRILQMKAYISNFSLHHSPLKWNGKALPFV
jgi:membrane-anchored protein YejM (alkaline phosphatase superfamily)